MIFKAIYFILLLAFATCEQTEQKPHQDQQNDESNENIQQGESELQNEGQQYKNYPLNQNQYDFQFGDEFRQYEVLTLVNNKNETLGFVYSVNSYIVRLVQGDLIPINDRYDNLVAYYSPRNAYKPDQWKNGTAEPPSEEMVLQLRQFGFSYVRRYQKDTGFFVVMNPYVFYFNAKGVLSPQILENSGYYRRQEAGYPFERYYPRPYYQPYQGPYSQYPYPRPSYYQQYPYARYPYNYYQYPTPF